MANDTDRILAAIEKSTKSHEAIWEELKEHSKEIAQIRSDIRLGNWKIGALVAGAMSCGFILIKPTLEKISKLIPL